MSAQLPDMAADRVPAISGAEENLESGQAASVPRLGAAQLSSGSAAQLLDLGGVAKLELARLVQADAVDWLRSLPAESVDLVITDPAYESLEKHRAKGTTTRLKHSKSSSNDWFSIFPNARFAELFAEVYRVLRRSAHFYMFCDAETMFVARPLAEAAGFKFWKPLVWDKQRIGMGYHYRARCEFVLFFEKGKRKLNDLGIADVIAAPRVVGGWPTEKPVAVSRVLIEQSTSPGQLVVDPFMGSASVGVAAVESGRRFAGCDLEPGAIALATARLDNTKPGWRQPAGAR